MQLLVFMDNQEHLNSNTHEYTFNNDFSVLRKEKRIVWNKKVLQTPLKSDYLNHFAGFSFTQ